MTPADWPEVAAIYAEGIATRNATFETEVPPLDALAEKWLPGHRWVAEAAAAGSDEPEIVGWTGVSPVSSRACYAGVGETSVTLRAGTKDKKIPVRIVKTLTPEALPLEGGHRIFFSMSDGKYEVEVTLPVEKTFAVEWRGAPYCAYKATGKTHRASCTLQGKGGAVIDNPAFLVSGATDVSRNGISIREIP